MGDIRKFGVMDKREYQATKRAEILANPTSPQEKSQEIKEMILGVPLFEKLNSRLKTKSPTIEQFRTQLIEVTGDRENGSKEAEKIRKIYIDAISHIKEGANQGDYFPSGEYMDMQNPQTTSENTLIFRSGKTNFVSNKDDTNIDILISILQNLKSKKK